MSGITEVSARILIVKFPNDRLREFHTNIQLTKEKGVQYLGKGGHHFSQEAEKVEKAGEKAMQLIDRIYQLNGVEAVSIGDYNLRVEIGTAFLWEEVQPHVLEIMMNHFGVNAEVVDVKQKYASGWFKSGAEPVGLDDPHPVPEIPRDDDRDALY